MSFNAYTKDGKQVKFLHKIDHYTAIRSGKFFINPPGTKVEPIEKVVETPATEETVQDVEQIEVVEDIVAEPEPEPEKTIFNPVVEKKVRLKK